MAVGQGNGTQLEVYECISAKAFQACYVFLVALPVHIFLLWILTVRFPDTLPRHTFLKSLNISDLLFLVFGGLYLAVGRSSGAASVSIGCHIIRRAYVFQSILILIASSGTVIGLSMERYVACVYCLKLHLVVTESRVKTYLAVIWGSAFCHAILVALLTTPSYSQNILSDHRTPLLTCSMVTVILFTSIILITTQVHIFIISRKKMRITPHGMFGEQAETSHIFKRHLKLSISVAVMGAFYVICLLPIAISHLYNAIYGHLSSSNVHSILSLLAACNILFDPVVYGLGMADVRRKIRKELLKTWQWFTERIRPGRLP